MTGRIAALHTFLLARKTAFLSLSGALILLCVIFSLRLRIHEDVTTLIPSSPPSLAERFLYLQRAPFMHVMRITVGGAGDPGKTAEALAERLRSPELPEVHSGPGAAFSPAMLTQLLSHAPALLTPQSLRSFRDKLDEDYVDQALRDNAARLLTPPGLALRELIAMDPLNIRDLLFTSLEKLGSLADMRIQGGRFVDPSGRYAMILAKPAAPMSDALASAKVMTRIAAALEALPAGTESYVTGGSRHTDANAVAIKQDLHRILSLSFVLVALLFLLFIRRAVGFAILLVPATAVCIASVVTAGLQGALSGMVLGFGSVLLGITSDYAVHTYYALSARSCSTADSLSRLAPPLLAGAGTTCAAFAALLLSNIPAIRQMALFGLVAIAAALVISLAVLPLIFRPHGHAAPHEPKAGQRRIRSVPAALAAGACATVILFCFVTIRFDGDIRRLSFVPPELAHDEEATRAIWKTPGEPSLVVAANRDMDQALRINDQVWEKLQSSSLAGKKGVTGIAPLLPSQAAQKTNIEAWQELWQTKTPFIQKALAASAPKHGFAPLAFAPFLQWITAAPKTVSADLLRSMGAGWPADMLLSRTDELSLVYTVLPEDLGMESSLAASLENEGARLVSGAAFREDIAESTGQDIARCCLLILAVNIAAAALVFRSFGKSLFVLLPMLAACAFILVVLRAFGISMTIFHAVALPLVMALSVDYGIFMLAALQGDMDENTRKSVTLSALTTVAGFGSLLLARHPVLFSLGLTVAGGISVAFIAALWLLPLLVQTHEQTGGAPRAHGVEA